MKPMNGTSVMIRTDRRCHFALSPVIGSTPGIADVLGAGSIMGRSKVVLMHSPRPLRSLFVEFSFHQIRCSRTAR
jgi:hypothetical protein